MKIKELDKLLELLNKFKEEPDYDEFLDDSEQSAVEDTICAVEGYKDFLGDDNE